MKVFYVKFLLGYLTEVHFSVLPLHPVWIRQSHGILVIIKFSLFQLETWREPSGVLQPVDVHVTPQQLLHFVKRLSDSGLKQRVIIPDIQR